MSEYKSMTPREFAELDFSQYTLLDLREPSELIADGIEGALNMPVSQGLGALATVPAGKPVIVFCRVGVISEEVAELLADFGHDVYNLEGGYCAYRAVKHERND